MSNLEYAANVSKLHKAVGELLSSTVPFKAFKIAQEVPVSELFPDYSNNKDKYDWVVYDMRLIIETHGQQHYKPATFGSAVEEAYMKFQIQQHKDKKKEEIVALNEWYYLAIPYTDTELLDSEYLTSRYLELLKNTKFENKIKIKEKTETKENKSFKINTEYKQKQLEKARQYRKESYQKMKEYKRATN